MKQTSEKTVQRISAALLCGLFVSGCSGGSGGSGDSNPLAVVDEENTLSDSADVELSTVVEPTPVESTVVEVVAPAAP